ncbi:MAG: acetyl-CoA carboxylase carboxyl transferase subunit beta [Chlamydiae bacterium CG10_big_fil_rev_8_21_14_0_10_35_9]|nr:MAG: acetyl-CoA carboxylase carboxyl transferase subunit beta [Chlamydiae bacterium CG10_big_fil_rev_8_21_14_0_10_35_9]
MGLFSKSKPKIKVQSTKKDGFSGWIKCSGCKELIHANELQGNINCCPKCGFHYRITVKQRISLLADKDSFQCLFDDIRPVDALQFEDTEKYPERLKKATEKSHNNEAITVGICKINKRDVALGVLDFSFMGGSMGSVVGERITLLIEHALEKKIPLILVSASGGARMQESILSLMQMAKTSAALAKLSDAKIPYISVLTNPTMGGVTASFASLGDIVVAEPDALIGFAGPRVVEQITKQKLPDKAQKSEFLLEHGMIDCIFKREELKEKISQLLDFMMPVNFLAENAEERLQQLIKMAKK